MNRWWKISEQMRRSCEIQYSASGVICSTYGIFVSHKDIRKLHRCYSESRVVRDFRTWVESKLHVNKDVSCFKFATPVHDGILYTEYQVSTESVAIRWETFLVVRRNPIKLMQVVDNG